MVKERVKNARPILKESTRRWALCNYGNIWSIHRTREDAKREAVEATGQLWSECADSFEIRKVTLIEGWS